MCINRTVIIRLNEQDMKQLYMDTENLEVDECIALDIFNLIDKGVRTLECCCGHGKEPPWCLIMEESHDLCVDLGYSPVKESDGVYRIILRGE